MPLRPAIEDEIRRAAIAQLQELGAAHAAAAADLRRRRRELETRKLTVAEVLAGCRAEHLSAVRSIRALHKDLNRAPRRLAKLASAELGLDVERGRR